ncbi:aldo/keto reductase [Sphingomonas naphthae]|uniref:Aldo/keto reductase n=1 Tax=Sphingomonas naphthae TaxID=1813468 RepID=A0ABY7TMT5_9SPHN|nr:aldo/keto reductase [Sphingomonas naphthae]WCT73164.1 aldo/keto reductase [Sphingomonas naphthae]
MTDRRHFLTGAAGLAALSAMPAAARAPAGPLPANAPVEGGRFRPAGRLGMGGTQVGSNHVVTSPEQAMGALQAAWDEGVRYFDTSPWYGLGLSERRFGTFFDGRDRDSFTLSTKVGRLLRPDQAVAGTKVGNWAEVPPFRHVYDYSAEGTRRSIEDSLQRLGVSRLDIVFIHDVSPDNADMGPRWKDYLAQAIKGAMPELTRMRKEGLIKAWGLGVNTLEPALAAFEAADPDIILSATQYSIVKHEAALTRLMPVAARRGASIVVGAPLNDGFLAGGERFNYKREVPTDILDRRARIAAVAQRHGTGLRTAALQFAAAHPVVSAIIPGARSATQAAQNADSMRTAVPAAFWADLKRERLIAAEAPVPA